MYHDLWKLHLDYEKDAEIVRHKLIKTPSFDVQRGFKQIDTKNNGYITKDDLQEAFNKKGV